MFTYFRTIYLRESDATGVLFFSELLNLAVEAVEMFWKSKGLTVQMLIEQNRFLLPIVHAECNFSAPLRVGDEIKIDLSLKGVGSTSFTLQTSISKGEIVSGSTEIVHVCVDKTTGDPHPIPESILSYLRELIQVPIENKL